MSHTDIERPEYVDKPNAPAAEVSASCLLEPSAVASPTFLMATRTVKRGA